MALAVPVTKKEAASRMIAKAFVFSVALVITG